MKNLEINVGNKKKFEQHGGYISIICFLMFFSLSNAFGQAGNTKVKICHKTGYLKDPCHELCVEQSSVQAHINHGDYLGSCLANCATPTVNSRIGSDLVDDELENNPDGSPKFNVKAFPNPTNNNFSLEIKGGNNEQVQVVVCDLFGRKIEEYQSTEGEPISFGGKLPIGVYFAVISQSNKQKIIKLVKQ